jgi:tetratricopeptide (TPR) repeat protein
MAQGPLCFVVMPFGTKPDGMGGVIDFDLIYRSLISPAVAAAGMSALRADVDLTSGGLIQVSLARLVGAPMAVFDITTGNPNVMYQLGIRHGLRPQGTLVITSQGVRVPFDLMASRVLFYELNPAGRAENIERFQRAFFDLVKATLQKERTDSPVYALLSELRPPELGSLAAETRPDELRQTEELKRRILEARRLGAEELGEIEEELGDLSRVAPEVVLTLFDAYRSSGAWHGMIELGRKMPLAISSSARVQEQLALALNRVGQGEEAEGILVGLLRRTGDSSETWAILGRVYKDRWEEAQKRSDSRQATSYLDKAIEAYMRGFETDWRDPYPGVNAVTLMTMREPPHPDRDEILPVVLYAVKRKLAAHRGDYWDLATLLELYVLTENREGAQEILPRVLAEAREPWQSATTARNLNLIREALERRGVQVDWVEKIVQQLSRS